MSVISFSGRIFCVQHRKQWIRRVIALASTFTSGLGVELPLPIPPPKPIPA